MSESNALTNRDYRLECLAALNDIRCTRFSVAFRQKHGLHDTYDLAARLERHLAQSQMLQQEGACHD